MIAFLLTIRPAVEERLAEEHLGGLMNAWVCIGNEPHNVACKLA